MCVSLQTRMGRPDHSVACQQFNQEMDPAANICTIRPAAENVSLGFDRIGLMIRLEAYTHNVGHQICTTVWPVDLFRKAEY